MKRQGSLHSKTCFASTVSQTVGRTLTHRGPTLVQLMVGLKCSSRPSLPAIARWGRQARATRASAGKHEASDGQAGRRPATIRRDSGQSCEAGLPDGPALRNSTADRRRARSGWPISQSSASGKLEPGILGRTRRPRRRGSWKGLRHRWQLPSGLWVRFGRPSHHRNEIPLMRSAHFLWLSTMFSAIRRHDGRQGNSLQGRL